MFERQLGKANDVALYAEQIEPRGGAFLDNFPQTFTPVAALAGTHADRTMRARFLQRPVATQQR